MSSITINDVKKLAGLSALNLSDEEVESLTGDLEEILNYVEQLGEVDTNDTEPTYQVVSLSNVYRNDDVQIEVDPEDLLRGVPHTKEQQILVPKVL